MNYSRVVIILFNMVLYKFAFSDYSFGKTRFSIFCFLFYALDLMLSQKN